MSFNFSQSLFSKPITLSKFAQNSEHNFFWKKEAIFKMNVLQEIQNNFILLNFCPSNSKNSILKIRNLICSVSCFIGMILYVLTSGAYIKRNLLNNFQSCLLATLTFTAASGLVYMMIVAYVLRYEIDDVFNHFQDIYDECRFSSVDTTFQKHKTKPHGFWYNKFCFQIQ